MKLVDARGNPVPSPWDLYLARLGPEMRQRVQAWFDSRPEPIQRLMFRCPPGSWLEIHGRPAFVVSYAQDGIFMSHTNPSTDHKKALAERFFVCADHLR
jgi:hypothetical protein